MDRQIVWAGQVPLDTDQLYQTLNTYTALGRVIAAVLGTATLINGLACTPTSPPSLQVMVGPGEIYSLQNVDASSYGSVGANTTHQIMKQGILTDAVTLSCPAPVTAGYSINYLVQVAFSEVDGGDQVLPYYNADDPIVGWSGPGGSGDPSKTVRQNKVVASVKAGTAAPTGTQTTPAADAGFTGAYFVTVAQGATTIVSGAIAAIAGAPFITERLGDKLSQAGGDARYATKASVQTQAATFASAAGTANALTASLTPAPAALVTGLTVVLKAANTNTGAATLNLNGLGVRAIQSSGSALPAGAITSGLLYVLTYDTAVSAWAMVSQPTAAVASGDVGDIKFTVLSTPPTGWLKANGQTIGDGSSGGTSRANADTANLFSALWAGSTNTELPIQDGTGAGSTRGVSAAADFAAHKRLPLPDARGRALRATSDGASLDSSRANLSAQADALQGFHVKVTLNTNFGGTGIPAMEDGTATTPTDFESGGPITDGTNGTPRVANETRMANLAAYAIIRF
jgi:hypothetical protein